MVSRIWTRRFVVLGCAAVAFCAPAVSAVATAGPHITATPNNVMVNSTVKLVGSGWAPNSKIALSECGSTQWIAPQDPCNSTQINVSTDKHGRFVKRFTMQLCPRTGDSGSGPVTRLRCYVGKVKPSGVDVISLKGHVKIIVTYP